MAKKVQTGARALKSRAGKTAQIEETQKRGSNSNRSSYHSIKAGKNIFRIAPAHDPENGALEPRQVSWLYFFGDDGKEMRRPVFNAKMHGDQERDIIEEYVDILYNRISAEFSDHKDRQKEMAPAFGFQGANGKFVRGIRPNTDWACYAWDDDGTFGTLNMYTDMVDRMEELSIDEESDEEIVVDPFSDPEEGVNLIIVYDPDGGRGKKYKVAKGSKAKPLTDAQLAEVKEAKSLADRYRSVYTTHDFDLAVEGLANFDEKYDFGIFQTAEWSDLVDELRALLPEPEGRDDDEEEEAPKRREKAPVKTAKPATKKSAVSLSDKKKLDKEYGINEMDGGELETFIDDMGLSVVIKTSDTEDSLREKVYASAVAVLEDDPMSESNEGEEEDDDPMSESNEEEEEEDDDDEAPAKTPFKGRSGSTARPAPAGRSLRDVRSNVKRDRNS